MSEAQASPQMNLAAGKCGRVRVVTGSRLHWGMFSFGRTDVRQFGGLGVMVDRPGLQLEVTLVDSASATLASGYAVVAGWEQATEAHWGSAGHSLLDRARGFARRYLDADGSPWLADRLRFRLIEPPQQHIGLGVGTQLALAVGRGLEALLNLPRLPLCELSQRLGRGRRSAVGIHGFAHGGLIVEAGKLLPGEISPLLARLPLPDAWRFVLLTPVSPPGLAGSAELAAFEQLPAVSASRTGQLCQVAMLEVLPAAQSADVRAFGAAIDRFGQLAGQCFAAQQGGVYASERVEALAALARRAGACGVAQSSWGPTLAAVLPSASEAARFIDRLQSSRDYHHVQHLIAAPCNQGAEVTVLHPSGSEAQ